MIVSWLTRYLLIVNGSFDISKDIHQCALLPPRSILIVALSFKVQALPSSSYQASLDIMHCSSPLIADHRCCPDQWSCNRRNEDESIQNASMRRSIKVWLKESNGGPFLVLFYSVYYLYFCSFLLMLAHCSRPSLRELFITICHQPANLLFFFFLDFCLILFYFFVLLFSILFCCSFYWCLHAVLAPLLESFLSPFVISRLPAGHFIPEITVICFCFVSVC